LALNYFNLSIGTNFFTIIWALIFFLEEVLIVLLLFRSLILLGALKDRLIKEVAVPITPQGNPCESMSIDNEKPHVLL
jgi:hypothetical protein